MYIVFIFDSFLNARKDNCLLRDGRKFRGEDNFLRNLNPVDHGKMFERYNPQQMSASRASCLYYFTQILIIYPSGPEKSAVDDLLCNLDTQSLHESHQSLSLLPLVISIVGFIPLYPVRAYIKPVMKKSLLQSISCPNISLCLGEVTATSSATWSVNKAIESVPPIFPGLQPLAEFIISVSRSVTNGLCLSVPVTITNGSATPITFGPNTITVQLLANGSVIGTINGSFPVAILGPGKSTSTTISSCLDITCTVGVTYSISVAVSYSQNGITVTTSIPSAPVVVNCAEGDTRCYFLSDSAICRSGSEEEVPALTIVALNFGSAAVGTCPDLSLINDSLPSFTLNEEGTSYIQICPACFDGLSVDLAGNQIITFAVLATCPTAIVDCDQPIEIINTATLNLSVPSDPAGGCPPGSLIITTVSGIEGCASILPSDTITSGPVTAIPLCIPLPVPPAISSPNGSASVVATDQGQVIIDANTEVDIITPQVNMSLTKGLDITDPLVPGTGLAYSAPLGSLVVGTNQLDPSLLGSGSLVIGRDAFISTPGGTSCPPCSPASNSILAGSQPVVVLDFTSNPACSCPGALTAQGPALGPVSLVQNVSVHGSNGTVNASEMYVHGSSARGIQGGDQYVRVPLRSAVTGPGGTTVLSLVDDRLVVSQAVGLQFPPSPPEIGSAPFSATIKATILGSTALDSFGNLPRIDLEFYVARNLAGRYSSLGVAVTAAPIVSTPLISLYPPAAVFVPAVGGIPPIPVPVPFPIKNLPDMSTIINFVEIPIPGSTPQKYSFSLRITNYTLVPQSYTAFFSYHVAVGALAPVLAMPSDRVSPRQETRETKIVGRRISNKSKVKR